MSKEVVAAITGIGVVAPCGVGLNDFWDGLMAEPTIGQREITDWDPSPWFDNPKEARRADRFSQFAIASTTEAIDKFDSSNYDPLKIGVSFGSGIGGITTLEDQIIVGHEKGPKRVSPFLVPMMMSNAAAASISLRFGYQGPCEATVTACAAGTHSIGRALDWLRTGRCEVVIAGSSESALTQTSIAGFKNMTALSSTGISRPFDKDRDGFVISEGAGTLVLERLDLAEKRGADILAVLTGSASTADAYHITAPSPQGIGAINCVNQALKDAELNPEDISSINAHGTSTPLNDLAESIAMKQVFGDEIPAMTSIKGITGHALGAAGAIEAVSVVLSMQNKIIPPTAGFKEPDPQMPKLDLVTEPRQWTPGPTISNSFGFGGHNGTIVIEPYL